MTVYDPANMKEGIWKVWFGNPAGSSVPDVMPLDSVAYGNPGGNFQAVGATQGGVTPDGINPPETAVYADHQRSSFGRFPGNQETTFAFNMIETAPEHMFKVSNIGALSTTAAGAGTHGDTSFKLTSPRRPDVSVLFEGVGGNGKPWRVFVPRARSMISNMSAVTQGTAQTMGVMVAAIPASDSEAVEFRQVTPPTS